MVLGFDSVDDYRRHANCYIGATIGRTAGRIPGGRFSSAGVTFPVAANEGRNHLHGGPSRSFDRVLWSRSDTSPEPVQDDSVSFEYRSPEGEEGYPGNLSARVRYSLSDANELSILFTARADADTPVNMTNHAYWNMDGDGTRPVTDQQLMVDADYILATDWELIPTGSHLPVAGSAFDFRELRRIGAFLPKSGTEPWPGIDNTFLFNPGRDNAKPAAVLYSPETGRMMELYTTEFCLQVYTANRLPRLAGRGGTAYGPGSGICLEPQKITDSSRFPDFPSVVLPAGTEYRHLSRYRFSTA